MRAHIVASKRTKAEFLSLVVWDTGFIPAYSDALTALTVEQ